MNAPILLLTALLLTLPLAGCAERDADPAPGTATPAGTPAGTPSTTPSTPTTGTARADDFENATLGGVPAGWMPLSGNWSVETNATSTHGAKVLRQNATHLGETFILDDAAGAWGDLRAEVRVNVLAGEKGQAGGIVFRYEDARNYYVVRYNHNELSWNLFRTVDGNREKFPGTDASAGFQGGLNKWFDLRLEARGSHIVVRSGDLVVIDHNETSPDAPTSGKVGLWTRYDSQTQFDGFAVRPL